MESAIVYILNPPKALDVDSPITYTCQECGLEILGYIAQAHAKNAHQTEFYVLKNEVVRDDAFPTGPVPEEEPVAAPEPTPVTVEIIEPVEVTGPEPEVESEETPE